MFKQKGALWFCK